MEDMRDILNEKKEGKGRKFFESHLEKLQASSFNLLLTVILGIFVMFLVCFAVFSITVRGEEQVMVPNVVGKDLMVALLEMQEKELYPKIQLRYTETDDAGKILNQNPSGGTIVKAGRRITLTVSRGAVIGYIDDYTGKSFDEVKKTVKNTVSKINTPKYIKNEKPAGTIIAQEPAVGETISKSVPITFVVSLGNEEEKASVPALKGMKLESVMHELENSKVVFDFDSRVAVANEESCLVFAQDETQGDVTVYSRVHADIVLPENGIEGNSQYGLFKAAITHYPFAVPMTLEAVWSNGAEERVVTLMHTGGNVTIPYVVTKEKNTKAENPSSVTELVLYVAGQVVARESFS